MTSDSTPALLQEAIAQLERIAEGQERIVRLPEHDAAERHHELMRALGEVRQALEKIERSQSG